MLDTVKATIPNCIRCQLFSSKRRYINPQSTLEHLASTTDCHGSQSAIVLDIWSVGPKNESKYKYLAASICASCRMVRAIPMEQNNSQSVADFLLNNCFVPSAPARIVSDRGSSVSQGKVTELLRCYNAGLQHYDAEKTDHNTPTPEPIKQSLSTPFYSLSHSQIERWFSTFSQSLRRLVDIKPETWPLYIQRIVNVWNSTKHRATGTTPNKLHLGLSRTWPDTFQILEHCPLKDRSQYIAEQVEQNDIARQCVLQHQSHYFEDMDKNWQKSYSNSKQSTLPNSHNFQCGEYVICKRYSGDTVSYTHLTLPTKA